MMMKHITPLKNMHENEVISTLNMKMMLLIQNMESLCNRIVKQYCIYFPTDLIYMKKDQPDIKLTLTYLHASASTHDISSCIYNLKILN